MVLNAAGVATYLDSCQKHEDMTWPAIWFCLQQGSCLTLAMKGPLSLTIIVFTNPFFSFNPGAVLLSATWSFRQVAFSCFIPVYVINFTGSPIAGPRPVTGQQSTEHRKSIESIWKFESIQTHIKSLNVINFHRVLLTAVLMKIPCQLDLFQWF